MSKVAGSIDTNAVIALLVGDIPGQTTRVEKLLDKSTAVFRVEDLVFSELIFVLTRDYGMDRKSVMTLCQYFMSLKAISSSQEMIEKALVTFVSHPALSFEDCLLATYAQLNDAEPLYTFDKKLARQHPSAVLL